MIGNIIISGAEYITDNVDEEDQRKRYFGISIDNLDIYNYILEDKIKNRPDLGKDEIYGRRVIWSYFSLSI